MSGAGILLFMSLSNIAPLNDAKMKIMDAVAPMIKTVQAPFDKSVALVRNVSGLATLQEDNQKLKAENQRLKEWYLLAKTMKMENAELKKMLNMQMQEETNYVTAPIMLDTSSPFAKSILVKQSAGNEIRKNAAVIASEGVVGRVIESGDKVARVLMLTDMNSRIPVIIDSGNERIHGVAAGQNTNDLKIVHLPFGKTIKNGAVVMTSGLGGVYPANLPVGVITGQVAQDYLAKPYMVPSEMTYVRIANNAAE